MLTLAYLTSRLEPKIEWFFDSLHRELGGNYDDIKIVVVDFHAQATHPDVPATEVAAIEQGIYDRHDRLIAVPARRHFHGQIVPMVWLPPKPTVWQGPHRRTQVDWFAASNARNTALCLAPDGHIAYVDDLSVLMPGWLARVREAMAIPNTVTFGAYKKVKNLVVEDGVAVRYDEFPAGVDSRWRSGRDDSAVLAAGSWLFGCSLVGPVEAFLACNGWPEHCDGLGSEDSIMGINLEKKGYSFRYDRRMLTLESEELHHVGTVMKRSDYGVSPYDKSHAVLNAAMQGNGWAANYFDAGGIPALRARVLAGEPFPVCQIPEHEWFTGTKLEDL